MSVDNKGFEIKEKAATDLALFIYNFSQHVLLMKPRLSGLENLLV